MRGIVLLLLPLILCSCAPKYINGVIYKDNDGRQNFRIYSDKGLKGKYTVKAKDLEFTVDNSVELIKLPDLSLLKK